MGNRSRATARSRSGFGWLHDRSIGKVAVEHREPDPTRHVELPRERKEREHGADRLNPRVGVLEPGVHDRARPSGRRDAARQLADGLGRDTDVIVSATSGREVLHVGPVARQIRDTSSSAKSSSWRSSRDHDLDHAQSASAPSVPGRSGDPLGVQFSADGLGAARDRSRRCRRRAWPPPPDGAYRAAASRWRDWQPQTTMQSRRSPCR